MTRELLLEGRVFEGSPEIILEERACEFLDRHGWNRFMHGSNGESHQILIKRFESHSLEGIDLDFAFLEDHRWAAVGSGGESVIVTVRGEDLYADDLAVLETISRETENTYFRREDFSEEELDLIDNIWKRSDVLGAELGMTKLAVNHRVGEILRRAGLSSRAELLLCGLHDGFIEPTFTAAGRPWPGFSESESAVLHLAYLSGPEIAERLGISHKQAGKRMHQCYRKTGAQTPSELILLGLHHGEFTLEDLPRPESKPELNEMHLEMLRRVDQPTDRIAGELGISRTAAKRRYSIIYERLNLKNREELVVYAFREGLIDNRVDPALADVFSERQKILMRYLLVDNAEMAERLEVSFRSLGHLVTEVFGITGAENRMQLISYALRAGLMSPSVIKPRA